MPVTYRFYLPDMGPCCAGRVQKTLRDASFDARVDASKQEVRIRMASEAQAQSETRKRLRLHIETTFKYRCLDTTPFIPHWLQGAIGLGLGGLILLLCAFAGLPMIAMAVIGGLGTLLTFVLGWDSFKRAWHQLKSNRKLGMDALFTVSTLLALAVSIGSLFVPGLPILFEVGLLLFGFRHLGHALQASMDSQVDRDLRFQSSVPAEQRELKAGDLFLLHPGQTLFFDGEALDEGAQLDESAIWGRNRARLTKLNQKVLAGIKLKESSSPLWLTVKRPPQESYLAKMDEAIESAEGSRAPIQDKTDRWLVYFVGLVFLIALGAGLVLGFLSTPMVAISAVVGVLASACPCTLGLIGGLALKIGGNKADAKGLRFYSAEALERAKQVDTVVFDLNGTLTQADLQMKKILWHDNADGNQDEALKILQGMEQGISHAVSDAICNYGQSKGNHPVVFSEGTVNHRENGLEVLHEGQIWRVGSRKMMLNAGVNFPHPQHPLQFGEKEVLFACGDKPIGSFILQSQLREGAVALIAQYQALKKKVYLCTGEGEDSARLFAKRLNIPENQVKADCFPLDKVELIRDLKSKGAHVAAFGDGSNDAPMMAEAHVAILLNSQTTHDVTKGKAGVQVKGASLKPLLYLFPTVSETFRLIHVNLGFSLVYNIVCLLCASGVFLPLGWVLGPALGAALMLVQIALLLLHALYVYKKEIALPKVTAMSSYEGMQTVLGVATPEVEYQPLPLPVAPQAVYSMSLTPDPIAGEELRPSRHCG